jgi:FAD synthetase
MNTSFKTAGIIIIGDEILSGKIQDNNAFFMAKELWSHGIQLCKISIIPDSIEEISEEVLSFSKKYDYVFTSGGIGPTHDDVTIEGISKAFNVKTVVNNTLKKHLEKKVGNPSVEQLKMAEVPEGAELIEDESISFPIIKFKNIYILPGIPELLRKKFIAIEKIFNEPLIFLRKIYIKESESEIAPFLKKILSKFDNIKIGSYPVMNIEDYSVIVTIESRDKEKLDEAFKELLDALKPKTIYKTE